MSGQGPLIIQSDHTILLEVAHPSYRECRDFLSRFAELVKSPEFMHTYRLTPLSIWNAMALSMTSDEIIQGLEVYSKYPIPGNVTAAVSEWAGIYGQLVLEKKSDEALYLGIKDELIFKRLLENQDLQPFWSEISGQGFVITPDLRGELKHKLIKFGYPVQDLCGYIPGEPLEVKLQAAGSDGRSFTLRPYQHEAVQAFYQSGRAAGGSGIVVLACGSGKTIVGMGVMDKVGAQTLIITTNNVSIHQWRHELLTRTNLQEDMVGEFNAHARDIRPVTLTTYQMLTYRRSKEGNFANLSLFTQQNWGLIIYDEVHLLPAPVFRATSSIQAKRRLGLTATLVREDGKEDDVFALIGPKKYDLPWKMLEEQGFIAEAECIEYRLPLPPEEELSYAMAGKRQRFRIAAENSNKPRLVRELLEHHAGDSILIIGQYISQVESIAKELDISIITGKTRLEERNRLYQEFREGSLNMLVVSKVANFAVDLPDANVMLQMSGTFGSRQEEAQRLGRILRPKTRPSLFYTLVSHNTDEQHFAANRQMFLVEQGYRYDIRYFKPD
ncbi:DNA repair helicase XPB [Desulfonatronospira sp.]|uniref:DNA repair helicase XPB n=1 Tax=Desulfonatronospira sp. TaxID=1962951 RepID=UPI0025BABDFE|nr:DNA repair helicase XPB [Desulfonatronospira sp.]